jgi:MGT family glycosyltransferase
LKQALADLPIQVILAASADFGPFPDNFIAQPWVPQLELLARVDLLVSHGGNNSVCEALALARPVVVLPVTNDQPAIAQQVVTSGCGLRLSFRRSSAAQIRDAVHRVLADPRYQLAARRISRSFEEAGGSRRAADLLEALAQQRFLQ